VYARETATFSPSYMSDTRKAVVLFGSNDSKRKARDELAKDKILGIL